MKVAITGGTGFVGKHLQEQLTAGGHEVYILTRSPEKYEDTASVTHIGWLKEDTKPEEILPPLDAIVNLAGESLFGYWTKIKKQNILNSRIQATENVLDLIKKMDTRPQVLINGSAVGFYGTSLSEAFTEATTTPGEDFLADVAECWEAKASEAESLGVRTVFMRFGLILGEEGALPLMALPFKMMAGGKVGSGEQWVSWIHVKDAVGLIQYAITNDQIRGAVNATAPYPKRNKELSKALADIVHRPYWLPVPSVLIKTALGDMSQLVLKGQCVYPTVAQSHDYSFAFPELKGALQDIFIK
ncbi:TIGR01777 family oxidoreductase [Sediminibacillus massiliensis]|uniref:TIGR01777 family oxidoreductase n=1 Tax=Sediminibacillus massiliensis TaxID=1926277 RepID=UPI0009883CE3|nr:TIGR01777 family oxidoreductase [Sediminibacillus massiliensis]